MNQTKFLEKRITKLWQLGKIPFSEGKNIHSKKIICAVDKIGKFAKEANIPSSLLINQYAYNFVYLSKERSFNKIYVKVGEFLDGYDLPKTDINDDDVIFSYIVEDAWNSMHSSTMNDFPFSLKSVLMQSGIKIMKNTFFTHSNNFQDFCMIANFVRHNRKDFPQIHSMKEFFLHIPILRKRPGKYMIWQYVDSGKDLDQYYKKLYGKIPKKERYSKFVALFQGNDTLGEFKQVWGVHEMGRGE